MSDIFISYKREEQATARKLADALENEGWSVWWDPKLRAGEHYDEMIEKALNEAKCVLVLWSEQSVQSRYVRDEATYALEKTKLVPVAIENVTLPFRFRGVQTSSLLHWDGSRDTSEFRRLVDDISAILGPTPMRRPEDQERRKPDEKDEQDEQESRRNLARKYPWRTYGLAAAAVAVMLIIFSFVFWPKLQGATEKVIILLADFDGPDPKNYRVTENIFQTLESATKKYDDVEIKRLYKPITKREVAQIEGKKYKASIVLRGWYGIPGEVVQLSVYFELLNPPKEFPELGKAARGNIQHAPIADLTSGILQPRLSDEMSYLSLFVLGMARRAAGDAKGAIDRFSDALAQKMEPSSSLNHNLVYFYRGLTYLLKGDSDHALADLNEAIKLQPKLAEAYVNRSVIYIAKGDYSHSLADSNQALQLKPDLAVAYNNRGHLYLHAKDYDGAIADFSQALKLLVSTHSSKTIRSDGRQLGSIKFDRDVPLATFVTEFSAYPVYINRGSAYLSKGDRDNALKDFNEAIKLQPNSIIAYVNRAAVSFAKQDYDHALNDLNQVIKLQPDFALAYMKRGTVYDFKGDTNRALDDLNQAIKLQPNVALSHAIRGELYAKRDDHDRAIADYSEAIKIQPDLSAYLNRGRSYREKGDYDRALADFNQALKLEPENAEAYNVRGYTYAEKGDFNSALTDLNQALALKPEVPNFYATRGFAYAGKGDYDRAMADYNQALKLKPDADYAYYHRGVLYRTLSDHPKAIADFKKTLELTKNLKRGQDAKKQLQELGAM